MKQSTLLISRFLIAKYPELRNLKGSKLRTLLHNLLKDPLLMLKMNELQSGKYTKQYQVPGQMLKRVDFYPYPEDWCLLSILSNGSGFSRCYIFIYLLEYKLGERTLDFDGTPLKLSDIKDFHGYFCGIGVDLRQRFFQRKLKTQPHHPLTPYYSIIYI